MIVDEVLERMIFILKSIVEDPSYCGDVYMIIDNALKSLQSSEASFAASNMKPLIRVLKDLKKNGLINENFTYRKIKETEVSVLLRSLWYNTREELGISARNIFITLLSSSLILGMLLLFIFVGNTAFKTFIFKLNSMSDFVYTIFRCICLCRNRRPIRFSDQFSAHCWSRIRFVSALSREVNLC
jgi:hypothetical protein